jgi:hypothetical protein
MPVKFSKEIGECYRLAAEARENASAAADPVIRQDFLDIERRWLLLATDIGSPQPSPAVAKRG